MKYLVQLAFNKMLDDKGLPLSEVVMALAEANYKPDGQQLVLDNQVETHRFFADPATLREMAAVFTQEADAIEKFSEDCTIAIINEYRKQLEKVVTDDLEATPGEEENAGAEQSNAG